jgi:RecB family endonuclease NucS
MIISYSKINKQINTLTETTFADYGILERQDIETWVENYPDILSEEERFYIITTEYDKFDKTNERLDILAIDETGTLTVIELKRDSSGKDVDLQAVKYAAYCSTLTFKQIVEENVIYQTKKGVKKSSEEVSKEIMKFISNPEFEELNGKPRIVLVAREYTPEVTSTVLWLRKFEINISCVRFKPYILDTETIVFESSVIIPLPEAKDFQIESEKRSNNDTLNRTQEEYLAFYIRIMENIQDKITLPLEYPKPISSYQIRTSVSGIHFEWAFHGRPRNSFGVEIHFEKGVKAENEKNFNEVIKFKDELEKATGETVIEDINWISRWSRIYIEKKQGNIDEDLIKWAVDKMVIFVNIINNTVDKLYL